MTSAAASANADAHSIVVEGLTKAYGDFVALNGISFRIKPGEIVGFLGPNGAGKTTTMKILTCFMSASTGEAKVAGFDVREQSEEVRRRIGYLPENVPLYDEMLVYDYLNFIAEVRGVPKAKRHERIKAVAELTGLTRVIARPIGELSKGYRQRVGLSQAIIHEPDVIVLDEPTTGLDPNQIVEIRDVIKTIGREKTIIFSTHILQEVTAVCDRIIIINQGKIVADGTLSELEARVASSQPGLVISFEGTNDAARLKKAVAGLDGVDRVFDAPARDGEHAFRVETSDEARVRRSLFKLETEDALGLKSIRHAEPTLEDIFRLFTGGATQEHKETDKDQGSGASKPGKEKKTAVEPAKQVEDKKEATHA
jgi:ABC-2 type transport system ATP-binding protein